MTKGVSIKEENRNRRLGESGNKDLGQFTPTVYENALLLYVYVLWTATSSDLESHMDMNKMSL